MLFDDYNDDDDDDDDDTLCMYRCICSIDTNFHEEINVHCMVKHKLYTYMN